MAAYVYNGSVIVGTGGGDDGNRGRVSAFSVVDGKKLWDWETIKRDTWPGGPVFHGGTDVWSGLAINPGYKHPLCGAWQSWTGLGA